MPSIEELRQNSNWIVRIESMLFHLSPSDMGQVGVFPEQQSNWRWIRSILSAAAQRRMVDNDNQQISVLNGFAFTGGSTCASLR